ncbi:MAG: hypothetical protein FWJ70_05340 [Micromonosporaceae bacterium]|jgi:hypothetical protein
MSARHTTAGLSACPTVVVLAVLLLAACAAPSDTGGATPDRTEVHEEFTRRAEAVAQAWRASGHADAWAAGFTPLEPLTVPPSGPVNEQVALAISAGWFRTDLDLSDRTPPDGRVVFADGGSLTVPRVSAAAAWEALYGGEPDCPGGATPTPGPDGGVGTGPDDRASGGPDDPVSSPVSCTALPVTGIELGTVTLRTSRGPAEVPAWLFRVEGLDAPVARVAVAPRAVTEVPLLDPVDAGHVDGLVGAATLVEVDGDRLVYHLGIGACDVDPAPLVYEADDLVVVGGTARPAPGTTACLEMLVMEEVSVTLAEPLGARPVLSTTGQVLTFGR